MNQTARISLQILKLSKSAETKQNQKHPKRWAHPMRNVSRSSAKPNHQKQLKSRAPMVHRCAAGEGLSKHQPKKPQAVF